MHWECGDITSEPLTEELWLRTWVALFAQLNYPAPQRLLDRLAVLEEHRPLLNGG